jgi:competence protein ComEA
MKINLPYFSRAQLGVVVLLGVALFGLWGWRSHFWQPPASPPARSLDLTLVEVAGAVPHPGVYQFDHPPTLLEAVGRAGGAPLAVPANPRLASGSRLEVGQQDLPRLGRMRGPQLLALGLALDLNVAAAADLDALPGIGPALAQRIIDYRTAHGPFEQVDDLMAVSGIGPHNLEKLKPYLAVGDREGRAPATGRPESESRQDNPEAGPQAESKAWPIPKKAPVGVMDPNLATSKDLETLPGIGPILAQRIVDYRQQHGRYKKITDLQQVSGIGAKKLEKIKPYLIIGK